MKACISRLSRHL